MLEANPPVLKSKTGDDNLVPVSLCHVARLVFNVVTCSLSRDATIILKAVVSFFTAEPLPLMDICRRNIRRQIGKENLNEVSDLPIPTSLKSYLLYR